MISSGVSGEYVTEEGNKLNTNSSRAVVGVSGVSFNSRDEVISQSDTASTQHIPLKLLAQAQNAPDNDSCIDSDSMSPISVPDDNKNAENALPTDIIIDHGIHSPGSNFALELTSSESEPDFESKSDYENKHKSADEEITCNLKNYEKDTNKELQIDEDDNHQEIKELNEDDNPAEHKDSCESLIYVLSSSC